MAELYELTELASYMQQDLDGATAELNRELTTTRIRNLVGRTRWADITVDQATDLKPVALDIAKRLTEEGSRNGAVRQESSDDYSVSFTVGTTGLIQSEIDAVLAVFGIRSHSGAFSITPAAPASRYGRVRVSEQLLAGPPIC